MRFPTAFCLSIAFLPLGNVAPCAEHTGPNIRVDSLVLALPQEIGLKYVPLLRDRRAASKSVDELKGKAANSEIQLRAAAVQWCIAGEIVELYAGEEIPYGTEFDPPQTVGGFGRQRKGLEQLAFDRLFGTRGLPAAFDRRLAGISINVGAHSNRSGSTITLSFDAGWTELRGFRSTYKTSSLQFAQPTFSTSKTVQTMEVQSGIWEVLAVSVIKRDTPEFEIFLLRATTFFKE